MRGPAYVARPQPNRSTSVNGCSRLCSRRLRLGKLTKCALNRLQSFGLVGAEELASSSHRRPCHSGQLLRACRKPSKICLNRSVPRLPVSLSCKKNRKHIARAPRKNESQHPNTSIKYPAHRRHQSQVRYHLGICLCYFDHVARTPAAPVSRSVDISDGASDPLPIAFRRDRPEPCRILSLREDMGVEKFLGARS